ncbi:MAG: helix-turn-helix transcriptional regulator [Chloroflexota bacterium]|nr:helix-turn-helix transcriptional regulator [Chloroflexota bacterium]
MSMQALRDREDLRNDADAVADPTSAAHAPVVGRVVAVMWERLGETLTLQDMADMAHLSPYYFTRVFRAVTGIPPAEYLAALRVQEAKRLLLTTPESVTDVCLEVGYTGLGTFTARFARLVGVPPGRLRRQADDVDGLVAGAQPFGRVVERAVASGGGVSGVVRAPDVTPGLIFIGLFPTPIPQSAPIGSALLDGPGAYHIPWVPDGRYYAMAAAFPASARGLTYLLPDDGLRVGGAGVAVTVRGGRSRERADIVVRPLRPTDPPLLTALPFLLVNHQRAR